jgi:hypothetical protein
MIVAMLALFVALGGPAQASRLISGAEIRRGSITSKQIKDRSLTARDLAKRTVTALMATPNGSITAGKLGRDSVTTRALAPGSVLSGSVGENSLTAADLAPMSVGADEVADNAIGQTEIRPNGVGSSEIADNTIDSGKVIDGGLSVSDVARVVGTFEWTISGLLPGFCQVTGVTVSGTTQLAGAFILASPQSAWPSDLVYTLNGTDAPSAFRAQACNRGLGPDPVAGATYVFNFAALAP